MRRWHAERDLMFRRWRQELANHSRRMGGDGDYPDEGLAPPSCAVDVDCHCANGIGTMRKIRPYGCGRARCHICHGDKLMAPKGRADRRAAIAFELNAGGE